MAGALYVPQKKREGGRRAYVGTVMCYWCGGKGGQIAGDMWASRVHHTASSAVRPTRERRVEVQVSGVEQSRKKKKRPSFLRETTPSLFSALPVQAAYAADPTIVVILYDRSKKKIIGCGRQRLFATETKILCTVVTEDDALKETINTSIGDGRAIRQAPDGDHHPVCRMLFRPWSIVRSLHTFWCAISNKSKKIPSLMFCLWRG